MERIYKLADSILKEMLENPAKGYSGNDIIQICNCAEGKTNIAAVLLNGKYIKIDNMNYMRITNTCGNFILSGGFKGRIKKEKLKICHIRASIISVIVTTVVAILTFVVLKKTNNGIDNLNKKVEKLEKIINDIKTN
jgi:hypothetical protein